MTRKKHHLKNCETKIKLYYTKSLLTLYLSKTMYAFLGLIRCDFVVLCHFRIERWPLTWTPRKKQMLESINYDWKVNCESRASPRENVCIFKFDLWLLVRFGEILNDCEIDVDFHMNVPRQLQTRRPKYLATHHFNDNGQVDLLNWPISNLKLLQKTVTWLHILWQ